MSVLQIVWLAAALALVGAGLSLASAVAGLLVANLACMAAGFAAMRQNAPTVRLGYYVAVVARAISVQLAIGSPVLALAVLAFGLPLLANEPVMRRWKAHQLQSPLGLIVGVALVYFGRSAGWWLLGLLPLAGISAISGVASVVVALTAGGVVRRASIRVGEVLPDFELPRREGDGAFRLSQQRGRHVLLCFVRGDWCPVCHVLMRIIMREAPLLERHGVQVVLITPSTGAMAPQLRSALGIDTQMLLDDGARQAHAFGLIEGVRHGEEVPLPVALLVGPDGVLLDISRPDDVTAFTSESRIARVLRGGQAATLPGPAA